MAYTVLIVDDSATMRAVVKKSLALTGAEIATCHEACNGKEALAKLRSLSINLVLADLNMPEMGGDVLIDQMYQDEQLREIPVVIISTEGSRTRLAQLKRPDVVAFLRKPFTPEQFNQVVNAVMEPAK
jgi:two-component system chemotaxis response regulator CheY